MTKSKERLDKLLVEKGLVNTRSKSQRMIMAGEVLVSGVKAVKPGTIVRRDAKIELIPRKTYVSRGGYKLAGALDIFPINIAGKICADVGACTGGFTDVLLKKNAIRVYAIDVGYGQLDWNLRQDDRVVILERTNARYLEALPETVDVVSVDVSFISLKKILPAVKKWIAPDGDIIILIKPQFEAGRHSVGKGGIVRDPLVHQSVLLEILHWCRNHDLMPYGLIESPITGSEGNREFLAWLRIGAQSSFDVEVEIQSLLN
jgi:23S rRNA (cytidine1920-2'-O)/16S rRNA (cytidine1409-2'-O)-methyltransferase